MMAVIENEISHKPKKQKSQTWTQLGHATGHLLSIKQAAEKLGVSIKTVTRWCESGKLPAMQKSYGTRQSYLISIHAIGMLTALQTDSSEKKEEAQKTILRHRDYVADWVTAMSQGLMNGRAFSQHTIDAYHYRVNQFLKKHPVVTITALKSALLAVPIDSVAVKEKTYKAIICFGKFLQREGAISDDFLAQAKSLSPRYHKPPTRHTVANEELPALFAACNNPQEWAIVHLLAHTGIRASELCMLTASDIDLEKSALTVQCGKGGKRRSIGLSNALKDALHLLLAKSPPQSIGSPLFLNRHGQPMNRNNLYQLLQRIGERVKIKVSPHALRRAFVTINANKGRPLQMLQIACGHSKITTTMGYCRTSEQEVIDAMKSW